MSRPPSSIIFCISRHVFLLSSRQLTWSRFSTSVLAYLLALIHGQHRRLRAFATVEPDRQHLARRVFVKSPMSSLLAQRLRAGIGLALRDPLLDLCACVYPCFRYPLVAKLTMPHPLRCRLGSASRLIYVLRSSPGVIPPTRMLFFLHNRPPSSAFFLTFGEC